MAENQYDNQRHEVKFLVPMYAELELRNILALEGWREVYPRRSIHSIYFDTINDEFLFDSVFGNSHRLKYRARWYNSDNYFVFECKEKNEGVVKKKISQRIPFFSEIPPNNVLNEALFESFRLNLFQRSIVAYDREYYYHTHFGVRLTLDFDFLSLDYNNLSERQIKDFFIVEVKAKLGSSFVVPFGQFQSRFSKYCFSRLGDDSFY